MTYKLIGQCAVCHEKSSLIALPAGYAVHLIDKHWDLVLRIHATTGDNAARDALNAELTRRLGR